MIIAAPTRRQPRLPSVCPSKAAVPSRPQKLLRHPQPTPVSHRALPPLFTPLFTAVASALLASVVPTSAAVPSDWACPDAHETNVHIHAHCEAVLQLCNLWRQGIDLPPVS